MRLVPVAMVLLVPVVARRLARLAPPDLRAARLGCAATTLLATEPVLASPIPFGVGFDAGHLPVGAATWAEAHHPTGALWNSSAFGGYLAMRLYPGVRILMDGRSGLAYDLADVEAVEASERDPAAFAALAARLGLAWAVGRAFEGPASAGPLAASPGWAMVYLDDVAVIYVRRAGPDGALAADGYRILRHTTSPGAVLSAATARGARAANLSHDGALALAQAPGSPRAAVLDACGAIATADEPRLRGDLARIAALSPGHPALAALADAWAAASGP